jgi:serralysin
MVRWGVIGLALLLLVPASASASEVKLHFVGADSDGRGGPVSYSYSFEYKADSGEANRLQVSGSPAELRVQDSGAAIRAGENCAPDGSMVVCRPHLAPANLSSELVDLGDLADETVTMIGGSLRGGPGDDILIGSGLIDGGPGGDRMTGGPHAMLDYSEREGAVRATFDGAANDGEAGEGDDVRGSFGTLKGGPGNDVLESSVAQFAWVLGGSGDDRVIGSPGADSLTGGPGDDVLEGNGGDDDLHGGDGADRSRGGAGTDTWASGRVDIPPPFGPMVAGLTITPDDQPNDGVPDERDDVGSDIENFRGSSMDDHITGTDGPNRIAAGGGADTIMAGGGDDAIEFFTGAKTIDPGSGEDAITAPLDDDDTVRLRDGERDTVRCLPATAPTIEAEAIDELLDCRSFLRFSKRFLSLRPPRGLAVSLRARCVELTDERCRGELRLYERGRTRILARSVYDIPAGAKRTVFVKLTKTGRKLLARSKRIPFVATASPEGTALPPTAAHARGALVRR